MYSFAAPMAPMMGLDGAGGKRKWPAGLDASEGSVHGWWCGGVFF